MLNTHSIKEVIAQYFKTQPVLKAWIFGSFTRGDESPLSDVDLLVQFEGDGGTARKVLVK